MAIKISAAMALLVFASCVLSSHALFQAGKYFDRIILVPFENTEIHGVLRNKYMRDLSQDTCSRLYGKYMAITHPSQPNYLTMIAPDYFGLKSDSNYVFDSETIIDRLDAKGISWGVYAEQYPGSLPVSQLAGKTVDSHGCGSSTDNDTKSNLCYSPGGCFYGSHAESNGQVDKLYARKHLPYLSFKNFASNEARCQKVKSATDFWSDADSGSLGQYVFFLPNQCHDGHGMKGCFYPYGRTGKKTKAMAAFLKDFLTSLKAKAAYTNMRTLVLILFDEGREVGSNQVYVVAHGCNIVQQGSGAFFSGGNLKADITALNHFSINALLVENFDLSAIGSGTAIPLK